MSSDPRSHSPSAPRRQSISLQDLPTTRNGPGTVQGADQRRLRPSISVVAPTTLQPTNIPSISTYWDQSYDARSDGGTSGGSPVDPSALQAALPPDWRQPHRGISSYGDHGSTYMEETFQNETDSDDMAPLTSKVQPISGSLSANLHDTRPRDSFQTVSDVDNGTPARATLSPRGDIEYGTRHRSYGASLDPNAHRISRSSSTSGALYRAGSIVRAMSQRVVNISGENEIIDQQAARNRSKSPAGSARVSRDISRSPSLLAEVTHPVHNPHTGREEKSREQEFSTTELPPLLLPRRALPNPLKGRTLGFFSPENPLRLRLCDALVNPYMEPTILLLIIAQTILLTVESATNVFTEGHERPARWGTRPMDWAMLGLFIVFTLELISRIIVSGFILNAAEYSTIDRKRGIRAAVTDQYRAVFQPEKHKSSQKVSRQFFGPEPLAIARSFTTLMMGQQALPTTLKEQQRLHLARRAFLRHSFNRLDFVAVVSFWISFLLGIAGLESEYRLYLFKMLSCLRILRLLALTNGTAIILRSLKRAAPLLVRVAFLIIFFWLLFAIIGMQSFKASLSRQCVWLDPQDPTNLSASYTHEFQFCGGYLDNATGVHLPWVKFDKTASLETLLNGTDNGKGYLCPRGSLCLQQESPYNSTVNFDNIIHSLELVFVIMSGNTFSDLMYYTMGSDYSMAALFFAGGIMVLTLWLINLLIAVITSSFQVIREDSKSSAFTADPNALDHRASGESFRRVSKLQSINSKVKLVWVLVIAFGLLCQALRSTEMSSKREKFIDVAEVIVTILLDIEMILRVIVEWRSFHKNWQNVLDLTLAIVTSIILIPPIRNTRAYWWLTGFQILRAYRVVLAVPVTRKLIFLVLGNAAGIVNLMMFVFLMTFLMAILAVQLFRGQIPIYEDGQLNPISFYTIFNAFLGMYQIFTSENWTGILYSATSHTTGLKTSWIAASFLIGWFILSFFILVNMFIAVIQENFDVSEDEKRLEQVKAFLEKKELGNSSSTLALSTIFNFGKKRQRRDPLDYGPAMTEMLLKDAVVREFLDDAPDPLQENIGEPGAPQRTGTTLLGDVKPGLLSTYWGRFVRRFIKREPNPFYANIKFEYTTEGLDARQMAEQAVSATTARRRAQREYLARYPTYNNSLYIFHPKNFIRRLCQLLVGPARGSERIDGVEPNKIAWYAFSAFVYAATVAMVVIACITTPLYQREYQREHDFSFLNWYVWTDLAFAVIFSFESVTKVIADGLINTPNAYLRSSWGLVDAVVLITLWINVGTLIVNDGAISRAVGAFKALRALRLLNFSNSARDTFHSLIIVGWWKIFGAAIVSISLLIPFAIYGLNLFNGLLVACNDSDDITLLVDCFGEFDSVPFSDDWALLAPRVASNPFYNFDDFAASLFTLFQIVSQEGWTDTSFSAQAITGRGIQPRDLANEGNAVFFVIFNLLATVFILTLFISVFMRNYTEQTGVAFLTAEQRSWLELRKLLRQISPSKSSYDATERLKWKRWCHKRAIEKRGKWYQAITIVLVLHLVMLLVEYNNEPAWWTRARTFIFLAFILLYVVNIAIRIFGLGWARFRRSSWDLYSMICVLGALVATVALFIADSTSRNADTVMQVHKFFLVAIVLLVIPRNDALDQLFKTAAASLTVIGNLLATWFVLFLVFAIAMTQAFSLTRFGEESGSDINFRTVPKALILLFRMSLGEGWNAVMEDYGAIEPPLCVDNGDFFESDCGSKPWARFLFVAWNILSMYIFVNLFVSLIYESFSYVYQRSSGVAAVDRDEIRRFKEAWRSVDPAGTGAISKEAFPRLLGELSGVFQMRIYEPEDSISSMLEDTREESKTARHMSVGTTHSGFGFNDVDLDKLNARLARLDVVKVRERRRRFNIFYEEVLVSADPDVGITFTSVLMILAHYNIINDSKSLRLDEFLRRRARLQRVDDSVRRKTVQGFFDTLYWTRKFRKHKESKRMSRMTAIPQLDIPYILVDDEDGRSQKQQARQSDTTHGTASPTHLSVDGSFGQQAVSSGRDSNWRTSTGQHPLSLPRSRSPSPSPPGSPSSFGFQLRDVGGDGQPSGELSRRGSSVSPAQARDMIDDSVWVESIRRSTTTRRSDRSSYRYADLG